MKIKAEITTSDIERTELGGFHCELRVNEVFAGDLYWITREGLQSLCDHIKTKTNE